MVEVRLDVAHARGLVEDADRPLALHVERLALDLVEHAVEEQRSHAERAVHRREHPARELAEGAPGLLGIDRRRPVGLEHELRQRRLTADAVQQHGLLGVAGAQPVQAVDVILRHHLVLLGAERECLTGLEPQDNEAPRPRALVPPAVDVGLRHRAVRVVAEERRHRAQQLLRHVHVDLRVVALALLRTPRGSRIEPAEVLAHALRFSSRRRALPPAA